jgi:2,3-bisphosphoglycerate-independent phosphoglycerate mutase
MIDKHIVGPVYEAFINMSHGGSWSCPDHPTPVEARSHCDDPVPFAMAEQGLKRSAETLGRNQWSGFGFHIEKARI